jgi:hypothetical protein
MERWKPMAVVMAVVKLLETTAELAIRKVTRSAESGEQTGRLGV